MGAKTNKSIRVENVARTLVNVDGEPECHTRSQNAAWADNARMGAMVQRVTLALDIMGEKRGNGTYRTNLDNYRPRSPKSSARVASWDLGHDLADDLNGPMCDGCNLHAQDSTDNRASALAPIVYASPAHRAEFERVSTFIRWVSLPAARRARVVNYTPPADLLALGLIRNVGGTVTRAA